MKSWKGALVRIAAHLGPACSRKSRATGAASAKACVWRR